MEKLNRKSAAYHWARINHIPYYQAREEMEHFQTFFRSLLDELIPWRVQGLFELDYKIIKERNMHNVATGEIMHLPPTPRPRVRFSPNVLDMVAEHPIETE